MAISFTPSRNDIEIAGSPARDPNYWETYREYREKKSNLESIISSMSSPVKKKISRSVIQTTAEILLYTNAEDPFEAKFSNALLAHFKKLYFQTSFALFHKTMDDIFVVEMENDAFQRWLAKKLGIQPSKFSIYYTKW